MRALSPPTKPNGRHAFTRWEMFLLWFAANRTLIGGVVGALGMVFLGVFEFEGHDKVADLLERLALLIVAGSGIYAVGAGAHKSDQFWKEKQLEATLPPHERPPQRRKSDS